MPIHLKTYKCLGIDLKMCILYGYSSQRILSLFLQNKLSHFCGQSEKIPGIFRMHLLLHFYVCSYETFQMFSSSSNNVHIGSISSSDYLLLLPQVELSHFPDIITFKVNR